MTRIPEQPATAPGDATIAGPPHGRMGRLRYLVWRCAIYLVIQATSVVWPWFASLSRSLSGPTKVRRMKHALVILLIAIAGCAEPRDESAAIRLEHTPWAVDGTLVSEDGRPVAGHNIEFLRVQRGADGRLGGYFFASTRTDSAGRFFLSSNVAGIYTVIASFEPPCIASADLGELDAGAKRSIRLALDREKDCRILL